MSKHHYARALARRGHRVFFLEPPKARGTLLTIRPVDDEPGLAFVSSPKVATGLRFMPAYLRQWLESRWLSHLEQVVRTRISVIWLFENSRFYDMRFARDRLKIYHQVDLNQGFHPRIAARTADIVFCTTEGIKNALNPHNSSVHKIHHGLAIDGFEKYVHARPPTIRDTVTINAAYIGNLEMPYLDTSLLVRCVESFGNIHFHLVGGYAEENTLRRKLAYVDNVTWWGKVDYNKIPEILDIADILLVTYRQDAWHHQASPHKFMEYLASGKVIVATWTEEYRDKRQLLEMVEDPRDFLPTLAFVAKNLSHYNAPERQKMRREFAFNHGYEKQLDKIRGHLASASLLSRFEGNP